MTMNRTNRCLSLNGNSAATWQRCAGMLGVVYCLSSLPLDTFMVGGNLQGRLESIPGSAIKERRHLQS
jgi:hypothetical protein